MSRRSKRKRRGQVLQKARAVGATARMEELHRGAGDRELRPVPHNVTVVHRQPNAIDLLRRDQAGDPPVVVR